MTYITPRIIAMASPSISRRSVNSLYKNDVTIVATYLHTHHPIHRVWNLCAEYPYQGHLYYKHYSYIPVKDHHPATLDQLLMFLQEASQFMNNNIQATIVVHCRAGKGRTGMFISALLVWMYGWSAREAMRCFAIKRMKPILVKEVNRELLEQEMVDEDYEILDMNRVVMKAPRVSTQRRMVKIIEQLKGCLQREES